ncbi:MAG: hypothetical protein OXC91_00800 [Rhodobacteraceae bacterium]|nr:hypothetical protein [Paracoccaceae bacterium]
MATENYEALKTAFYSASTDLEEQRRRLIELQDEQRDTTEKIRRCKESIKNLKQTLTESSQKILEGGGPDEELL